MSNDIYRRLQQRLDTYTLGYPETESGVEIKILKKIFSIDEAELFLNLSMKLESPETVASRIGIKPEEAAEKLEQMAQKGLLFRFRIKNRVRYSAIPFIVGIYEFQLKRLDSELAGLTEAYFNETFFGNMTGSVTPLRTIPVNESIESVIQVAAYSDARELVKNAPKIAIADCICRIHQARLDISCEKPSEVCFSFGASADYYVENGMGRFIDVEEGLSILAKSEEAGLVVQPESTQNPGGMCNCCGDCCGPLRALKKLDSPADLVMNNYFAEVEAGACTGCETCLDRCQMDAIRMTGDETASILLKRCIGCGLCVTTCPGEAITLHLKPVSQHRTIPANGRELLKKTAERRGLISGSD